MSETMTAIRIEGGCGPAQALVVVQGPRPAPREGELLPAAGRPWGRR